MIVETREDKWSVSGAHVVDFTPTLQQARDMLISPFFVYAPSFQVNCPQLSVTYL